MPKMKDLGINVIPETMRPPECLPWTVGPVCVPGGFTRDAGCFPTSCGVSPAAAAFQSTATCVPNSCGMAPEAFQSTATCIPNSCGVAANPAAFQSTATCIPNSCGVACGCTHITNPCLGCTIAITYPCATHTTITVCANLSHYRHTGATEWLSRARQLANHAASVAATTAQRPNSLWKGELGVAVLIADLASPENAALPFFE